MLGKGLENSTAPKTTYRSKVKFGYHEEGGRNIRKSPLLRLRHTEFENEAVQENQELLFLYPTQSTTK